MVSGSLDPHSRSEGWAFKTRCNHVVEDLFLGQGLELLVRRVCDLVLVGLGGVRVKVRVRVRATGAASPCTGGSARVRDRVRLELGYRIRPRRGEAAPRCAGGSCRQG